MSTPISNRPKITDTDLQAGYVNRYFVKNISDKRIVEIDATQHKKFVNSPYYETVVVPWVINGMEVDTNDPTTGRFVLGVPRRNLQIIDYYDSKMQGLRRVLRNPMEYFNGTPAPVQFPTPLATPLESRLTTTTTAGPTTTTTTAAPTTTTTSTTTTTAAPTTTTTSTTTAAPTTTTTSTTTTTTTAAPVEQLQFIDAYKAVAQYNLNEYGPYEYTSGVSSRWVVRDFNLVNINNNLQSDVVRTTFDVDHSAIETTVYMYKYAVAATNVGGLALFVPTSSIGTYDNTDYLRGQFVSIGNTMQIVYVSSSGEEVTLASSAVAGWSLSSGTNITMEVRNNTASLYSGSVKIVSASLPSQLIGITNRRVGYFNYTTNGAGALAFRDFQISTDVPFGTPSYIPIVSGTVMYLDASSSLSYTSGSSTWADLTKFGNSGSIAKDVGYSSANSGSLMFIRTGSSVVTLSNEYSIKPELPLTIMGWVKSATGSTAMGIIGNEAATANYRGAWLSVSSLNAISINYGSGGTQTAASRRTAATANASFPSQSWTHIAAVIRDATDMSIYINNVSQSLTYSGTGGTISYSTTAGAIGWNGLANEYFSGSIAQMGIYARELLSSEIQSHYNSTQNRFTP